MLSDSAPPAMMICAPPDRMRSAAIAMACSPDEQKRLMVMPGTESGRPARKLAMRAMFIPDSASGIAHPRITSSISSGAMAGCFSSRRRMTMAARSSGRVLRRVPLGALPTGVRKQSRITASMVVLISVSERFARLQHILHALLGLRIAAQAQKSLAFQIQQILLGNALRRRQTSSAQNVRQLVAHQHVVIADEIPLAGGPRAQFHHGVSAFTRHLDVIARRARRIIGNKR